jgi:peptide/nickel transport system substrate-binding protein
MTRQFRALLLTAASAAALAALLALAACNANAGNPTDASGSTAATTKGGTLTILTASTDINLDPAKSQNLATTTLGLLLRRLRKHDLDRRADQRGCGEPPKQTGTITRHGRSCWSRARTPRAVMPGFAAVTVTRSG